MNNIVNVTVRYDVPGADAQIVHDLELDDDSGTLVSSTFKGVEFQYNGTITKLGPDEVEQLMALAKHFSELRNVEEGEER